MEIIFKIKDIELNMQEAKEIYKQLDEIFGSKEKLLPFEKYIKDSKEIPYDLYDNSIKPYITFNSY